MDSVLGGTFRDSELSAVNYKIRKHTNTGKKVYLTMNLSLPKSGF